MASIKVVLRKKKNKEGKFPLAIRIIDQRKTSFIYLSVYIELKNWDEKNNLVKKRHPNSVEINNLIQQKLAETNKIYLGLEAEGKAASAKQIQQSIKNPKQQISFFKYSADYLKNLKATKKLTQLSSEKPRVNAFNKFIGRTDLRFPEITESLLRKYIAHLKSKEPPLSEMSIVNNLIVIRTIFNQAIRDEIVDQKHYPFGKNKIKIKKPESIKTGLTKNDLRKVEVLKLEPGTTIQHVRNVWLFSFYLAGIRVSDTLRLRWSDIHDSRLEYAMGKNMKIDSLKLPEKAIEILKEYESEKRTADDYIFPELKKAKANEAEDIYRKIKTATKKFNKYLNIISERAGVAIKITNHISRHTFGNIAGDKVSPQMLQKLYRHTHISTTMGYQKNWIHKDADEALDKVLDY